MQWISTSCRQSRHMATNYQQQLYCRCSNPHVSAYRGALLNHQTWDCTIYVTFLAIAVDVQHAAPIWDSLAIICSVLTIPTGWPDCVHEESHFPNGQIMWQLPSAPVRKSPSVHSEPGSEGWRSRHAASIWDKHRLQNSRHMSADMAWRMYIIVSI